ncbi:DUF2572 domain-containing protein, partial [Glaesserella parasuis]|nr:DUF2572 domain-containing protein [Glaesserella parasuis]
MKRYYSASSLLITLILLSGLFAVIFLNKDSLLKQEKVSLFYYQQYLTDKYQLIEKLAIDPE